MSRSRTESAATSSSPIGSPTLSKSTKNLRGGPSPLRESPQRRDSSVGMSPTPRKDSLGSSNEKRDKKGN